MLTWSVLGADDLPTELPPGTLPGPPPGTLPGTPQQITAFQSSLIRTAKYFNIPIPLVAADGVVGPSTIESATKVVKSIGAIAHPAFTKIATTDPSNLTVLLSADPVGFQQAFDAVYVAAWLVERKAVAAKSRRRWIYGSLAVIGASAAAVAAFYYLRRFEIWPEPQPVRGAFGSVKKPRQLLATASN